MKVNYTLYNYMPCDSTWTCLKYTTVILLLKGLLSKSANYMCPSKIHNKDSAAVKGGMISQGNFNLVPFSKKMYEITSL